MNEETHHKMSKKIAQLTKVIFHLHSKNEENSAMHTSIQNAYEKEIETLLNSANSVISKQKDSIEKAQDGEKWRQKIRDLEEQHTAEKKESHRNFDKYKAALERKEQDMEREHKQKIVDMKTEVMDLKAGFDARVQEFKK